MKLIIAILNILLSYFRPKPVESYPAASDDTPDIPPPIIKPPKKLVIPHPEEPPDYSLTVKNIEVHVVVAEWLSVYKVPTEYWGYWKDMIDIQVYEQYPDYMIRWGVNPDSPAFAWYAEGKRHMAIKPAWLNIGVICHENCHTSYSLLTDEQKDEFSAIYTPLKTTDPLIVLLYSQNPYGLKDDVEAHGEIGRFLGDKMPEELKKFYPRLF